MWGIGFCGVTPKYICNILFLWYRISTQISSPEQLTQLSEIISEMFTFYLQQF